MAVKRLWCWVVGHDWWSHFRLDFSADADFLLRNPKTYCARCGQERAQ